MSETLTLSPELQPKKKFNWFKLIFNAIWISFLVWVFVLAGRSMFAYWSIYRSIPVAQVEFFAIFNKKGYQNNSNWQEFGGRATHELLGLERGLWEDILATDQAYWAIYWENSADIKAKLLIFSYSPLPAEFLAKLESAQIPYSYDQQVLLINGDDLQIREQALPDLLIFNNICVGRWQKQSFSCEFDEKTIRVSLNDNTLRPLEKANVFNIDALQNKLLYVNNQLKLSEISQFLPENLRLLLSPLSDKELSLAIFDQESQFFVNNWAIFLENVDNNELLSDIQYQVAYQNREIRDNELLDGSHYHDEILNFETFSWQEENFNSYILKKIPLDQKSENFLYAYPFQKNLILSSDKNLYQTENLFLSPTDLQVKNFSTPKVLVQKNLLSEIFPWKFLPDTCQNLKIEEKISNYIFSACD